jgi:hypothetical protein
MLSGDFAAYAVTLFVAHAVADYWIQTHRQAMTKGERRPEGVRACLGHVATYTAATMLFGAWSWWHLDLDIGIGGFVAGQLVSAISHYWADRRYTLAWLAKRLGKEGYYNSGGAAALDQSWHLLWIWVAAQVTF